MPSVFLKRSVAHATRGGQRRGCRRDGCYYHLQQHIPKSLTLHFHFQLLIVNYPLSIVRSATSGDASLAKNCRRPLPFIQGRVIVATAVVTASVRAATVLSSTTVLGVVTTLVLVVLALVVLDLAAVAAGHALQHVTILVQAGDLDAGVLQLVLHVHVRRVDDTACYYHLQQHIPKTWSEH